tara:strand:+ start:5195 stop:7099 length:1905 start_codon:yes stop_codon:yes gene_type:complete
MEASYFYYRPSDLIWEGDSIAGHYLDKGFNVKFKYMPKNKAMPHFAIGLDDFAGTGFFTREYFVSTIQLRNTKFSLGMGWGKYSDKNTFDNPLSFLASELSFRPDKSNNYKSGGSPSADQWFRGDATIFGGVEFPVPKINKLSIKLEYDPFDYVKKFSTNNKIDASYKLRKKDSNINIGLSYPYNKFINLEASFIKGNTLNLSITIGATFNDKLSSKPKFSPVLKIKENKGKVKRIFYEDLLYNLNNNNLLLQTASLAERKLDITISTSQHRNAIRSSSYAGRIANDISKSHNMDVSLINIGHINAGVELNNITYIANHLDKRNTSVPIEVIQRYTQLEAGNTNDNKDHEFQPNVKFPAIFSSLSPSLVSYIGNPEKFFFGGVDLQHVSEIQFNRSLLLSSEINYSIYNNFQDTVSGPASKMEHVRTDKVQYLKNADLYIARMQLDYIWSPGKNIYAKLSGGLFESMFGGVGAQVLYKPFKSNLTLGIESFYVRQRAYNQVFKFRKYKTSTSHFNISYLFPMGIESNLSFGRYLAKDDGFTLDLSRKTRSGFKAGVYFTRTNVSPSLFGEGSFDKGFYFQVPLDLFSNEYKGNYSNFKLSPLTRDGGAKLEFDKDLRGLMHNSSFNELRSGWTQ